MSAQAQTKPAEQPLSGQQVSAMQKQMSEAVSHLIKDIELRKLALRHACDMVASTGGVSSEAEGRIRFHDPVSLAKQMHDFLTGGITESAPAVKLSN